VTIAMRASSIGVLIALACGVAAQQKPAPALPGRLVDLDGYRIHLNCTGKGHRTVLLSPGAGDFSFDWFLVQQKISKFIRVCSYDRAGSAWSDPGPQPLTMKQESFELHTALERAGERGPYILVGQSLGGLVMRVFADQYPNDTAGMVLVDATSPDTTLSLNGKLVRMRELAQPRTIPDIQTMQSSPPRPPTAEDLKQWDDFRKQFGEPKIEPPFDRLPSEIQKLQRWASSLPPPVAASDNYLAEELAQMYAQLQRVPVPLDDKPPNHDCRWPC
jgi:pimeloyl-ACP methyl ester carboxylesterase